MSDDDSIKGVKDAILGAITSTVTSSRKDNANQLKCEKETKIAS